MEELTEESLKQRRDWVKFDEDGAKLERLGVQSDEQQTNNEAAVITVENGPKSPTNGPEEKREKGRDSPSAVIETTQSHVSNERHPSTTASMPSPAPRVTRDQSPHASQPVPKAAARAHKSTPHKPQMTPTTTGSPNPTSGVPPPNPRSRSPNRGKNETVIQMPLREAVSTPAAAANNLEMQTVSLSDAANGSLATSSVLQQVRKNITRQAFANGDILVTLLPQNIRCPWLTRAEFRPELVPEELMSQHLTLTVEEYLSAMEVLVNDFRFNCYNICYKRILMAWILLGFLVLLALLFSGVRGIVLFGAGVIWLLLNASGIFVCMWIKIRLRYHLEGCVAQVNKYFLKHKILMGVDDRGKLSCHKVNLIFVYFDCTDCVRKLNEVIENEDKLMEGQPDESQNNKRNTFHARMDIDDSDIIITGNSNTRVSRQQERGERLLLRYSQRWVKEYVCKRLDLSVDCYDRQEGEPPIQPRHCLSARCPCQFIEQHLRYKPRGKFCGCTLLDF